MRANHIVIIVDRLKRHAPQMSGIQDKDQIQALLPDSPNPMFGIRIAIRCQVWGVNDMKGFTLKDSVKGIGELAVIVVDQETQGGFSAIEFPYKLSGLLGEPEFVGVGSDAGESHPARTRSMKKST